MEQKMKEKFQKALNEAQKCVLAGLENLRDTHNELTVLNGVLFEEHADGWYIPKHFKLYELLPREIYDKIVVTIDESLVWGLFDSRFLWTIDACRKEWNVPVFINTWHHTLRDIFQNVYNWSGYRPFDVGIGALYSQHKFFRAGDLKIPSLDIYDLIQDIKNHSEKLAYKYITCVEEKCHGIVPSWLHLDTRNCKRIKFIEV
jgi:hypothetical protein